jgi:hypothetical protein
VGPAVTVGAVAEVRKDASRLVGFLEANYALRYLPVHDLAAHRDVQVAPRDVAVAAGVAVTGGGEPWLAVELVDLPASSGTAGPPGTAGRAARVGDRPGHR